MARFSRMRVLIAAKVLALIAALVVIVPLSAAGAVEASCTATDNGDGTLTLDWGDDGDVRWAVRTGPANASSFFATINDTPTATVPAGSQYSIRFVQQENAEIDCTSAAAPVDPPVDPGPAPQVCTASENADGTITVSWDLTAVRPGVDGVSIRRYNTIPDEAVFQFFDDAGLNGDPTIGTFVDGNLPQQNDTLGYTIRVFGPRADFDCGLARDGDAGGGDPVVPDPVDPLTCTATLQNDGSVLVTWTDDGANRYVVRRGATADAAGFIGDAANFQFIDTSPPAGSVVYVVRSFFTGNNVDTACPAITLGTVQASGCSAVLNADGSVTVTRNNDGANSWGLRRGVDAASATYIGEVPGTTFVDANPPAGDLVYVLVSRLGGGNNVLSTCGDGANTPAPVDPAPVDPAPVDPAPVDPAPVDPAPVDPAPAALCTAVLQADGSVLVSWDLGGDRALRSIAVRRYVTTAADSYFVFFDSTSGDVGTYLDTAPPANAGLGYVIRGLDPVEEFDCGTVGAGGGGTPAPVDPAPPAPPAPPAADPVNLSEGQTATQSSTFNNNNRWNAGEAVDGDTNGANANRSITHTNIEAQPWWQVDLGASSDIFSITLWNRTDDCCGDRLSDVVVFISDTDMTGRSLAELEADASVSSFSLDGEQGVQTTIDAINESGRFVRVQLRGTNALTLAELVVLGTQ